MSIISAGTSNTSTLVYTGDTTGNLAFQINGTTEAMRIDTGGNVGIGETSPAGSANYKQLVIRGTSGAELSLKGGSTQYGYVYVDNGGFRIINPQSGSASGTLQFHTSNTERMRIAADGNVGIGTSSVTSGVRLDVVSDNSSQQYIDVLKLKTSDTGDVHPSLLLENNRGSVQNAVKIHMDSGGTSGSGFLGFRIKNSGGTYNLVGGFNNDGNFYFNSGYGSSAVAYGTRAWVNFAGSSGSINASGGVSSVTRNGTGDYTVNYSFTFPDANYTMMGMGRRNSGAQRPVLMCLSSSGTYNQFTTSARFYTMLNDSATIEDPIQFWFLAVR